MPRRVEERCASGLWRVRSNGCDGDFMKSTTWEDKKEDNLVIAVCFVMVSIVVEVVFQSSIHGCLQIVRWLCVLAGLNLVLF